MRVSSGQNFATRQLVHLFWAFFAPMRAMRHLRTSRRFGVLHPVIIEQVLTPVPIPIGLAVFLFEHSQGSLAERCTAMLRILPLRELLLYGGTFLLVITVCAIIPRVLSPMIQAEISAAREGTVPEQVYVVFLSYAPLYLYPLFHGGSRAVTAACYAFCMLWMTGAGVVLNRAYYAPELGGTAAFSRTLRFIQGASMLLLACVSVFLVLFTIRIEDAITAATR